MILLLAVAAGLIAGAGRAWWGKHGYQPLRLVGAWVVLVAFLPQLLAFQIPWTRARIPDSVAPVFLVGSQILLLVFVWYNRRKAGFWTLGLGLILNLSVIVLNGGLMPISPETVASLNPGSAGLWQTGQRLGTGKDIVLEAAYTRLGFLSDRFLLPDWIPYRVAFSAGDVLIALGAFLLLWSLGGNQIEQEENKE